MLGGVGHSRVRLRVTSSNDISLEPLLHDDSSC